MQLAYSTTLAECTKELVSKFSNSGIQSKHGGLLIVIFWISFKDILRTNSALGHSH